MHGWALATFVKGMKIRLRKNWLSILAKRKIPQSRNCLWCDELMINYDRYGLCCVWRGLCNQECMNEWPCITFCNQARRLGGGRGAISPSPYGFWLFGFFFGLSAQSRTVMMIIPLPSGGATGGGGEGGQMPPPPYDFRFCLFVFWVVSSAVGHGHDSTPTPLWFFFMGQKCVGAPPPAERLFQGWRKILWLAQQ